MSICNNSKTNIHRTVDFQEINFDDLNQQWISLGPLVSADLSLYNNVVGIYRHRFQGEVVYIGRAIELNNGGFRKRLSDYKRDSDSARKHKHGRLIHEHINDICTDIIVIGNDENAVQLTTKLEILLIGKYNPEWNKQFGFK